MLSGCISNPFATAPVDPRSPIAAEVAKTARSDRPYPTFADVPPKPTDVRPLAAYGSAAQNDLNARTRLEQETAPGTWSLEATDAFAARAESAVGGAGSTATGANAGTEAFSREGQARATPPPSPK
jgi:hypothetical protein